MFSVACFLTVHEHYDVGYHAIYFSIEAKANAEGGVIFLCNITDFVSIIHQHDRILIMKIVGFGYHLEICTN